MKSIENYYLVHMVKEEDEPENIGPKIVEALALMIAESEQEAIELVKKGYFLDNLDEVKEGEVQEWDYDECWTTKFSSEKELKDFLDKMNSENQPLFE